MVASDLSSIEITCPKCGISNRIIAGSDMEFLEIACSKCHALMGKWRDLKRIADDQERRL